MTGDGAQDEQMAILLIKTAPWNLLIAKMLTESGMRDSGLDSSSASHKEAMMTQDLSLDSKFDLLLKTTGENKKKRVEAEERSRAHFLDIKRVEEKSQVDFHELKKAVKVRLPQVEK
uniref:Uncharacterized protein n=1 Tax=Oryza nivara TaxID=4536 RepID=A0A0E0GFF9_ORYNI